MSSGRRPGARLIVTAVTVLGMVCGMTTATADPVADSVFEMIELGTLPGGGQSSAKLINDQGMVVGTAVAANGTNHTVRWDKRGNITDLGLPSPYSQSTPNAVNNKGVVVGSV